MNLTNDTPFEVLYLPGRLGYPSYSLTVIVKATFALVADGAATLAEEQFTISPDLFAEDDPDGARGLRYESDLAHFRPSADLLCVGNCYAPGRSAVSELPIEFRVGRHKRVLRVSGDRRWEKKLLSAAVSNPKPFREMDLGYHRSFGGSGFAMNPIGRGYFPKGKLPSKGALLLPNIEDPAALITSPKLQPPPAGLGPLMSSWEPRIAAQGTYGESWFDSRCPWFPEDLNWSAFNAAPNTMQIKGYLRGDEPLLLRNLHRDLPNFRGELPGTRVRAFVEQFQAPDARWEAPKTGFHELPMNLDTLWVDAEAERLVLVWRGAFPVSTEEFEDVREIRIVQETLGESERHAEHYRTEAVALPVETPAPAPVATAEEKAAALDEEPAAEPPVIISREERLAQAHAQLAAIPDIPQDAAPDVRALVADARAGLLEAIAELESDSTPEPERPAWTIATLEQAVADGRSLAGEAFVGFAGAGLKIPGADLSATTWTGADLSDADLTGANLVGADLSTIRLAGANLSGADLRGAILRDANLERAILSNCKMDDADLEAATLSGADLSQTRANSVNFKSAQLGGANLERAELGGSNLANARLVRCSLKQADLCAATFEGADLTGADLSSARLDGAQADRVVLVSATLTEVQMTGGSMRLAQLSEATGPRSSWVGVDLTEANLGQANFEEADFSKASLRSASIDATNLRGALLRRTDLSGASLVETDLSYSLAAAADFTNADLRGANLVDADLSDATFSKTNLRDANVSGTRLARR